MTHVPPDGTRVLLGTGYSGQGNGLNNPSEQYTPNSGPIPQRTYTIEPQRDNVTGAGHKLPGSMRLDPTSDTDTHRRAGFLIHGGNSRGDLRLQTAASPFLGPREMTLEEAAITYWW